MRITIRMPRKLLAAWLEALRSGKYRQGRGRLERDGAYCCLGLLQQCIDEKVERRDFVPDKPAFALPSHAWLISHGVQFLGTSGSTSNDPIVWEANETLSGLNDKGVPFSEIADFIEACAEPIDG